jgi:exosortase family protein XrtF
MANFSFTEFRPTILFLAKFIGFYLIGNLLYGYYITHYSPAPDPVTRQVTKQTVFIIKSCGADVSVIDSNKSPTSLIVLKKRSVLAVYEGCNGINTMIIFVAFLFAFGPLSKSQWWFLPLGLAIIHLANLARIALLFYVSEYLPKYMYFTHKYLFTATLYCVVFLLWVWWVRKFSLKKNR